MGSIAEQVVKIFIAGPRSLRKLDGSVKIKLGNIINKNYTVLVGDAVGVDKLTQQFLHDALYNNVVVYASQGKARNNVGNWRIENVTVRKGLKGFDFYTAKDQKMAEDADYGFMIWNGKSKGTLNNIINLSAQNKKIFVYFVPHDKFYTIKNIEDAEKLAKACGEETTEMFKKLRNGKQRYNVETQYEQMTVNEVFDEYEESL